MIFLGYGGSIACGNNVYRYARTSLIQLIAKIKVMENHKNDIISLLDVK